MKNFDSISDRSSTPAIYAMFGGQSRQYVAYVGLGTKLKGRVEQRLAAFTIATIAVLTAPDRLGHRSMMACRSPPSCESSNGRSFKGVHR